MQIDAMKKADRIAMLLRHMLDDQDGNGDVDSVYSISNLHLSPSM